MILANTAGKAAAMALLLGGIGALSGCGNAAEDDMMVQAMRRHDALKTAKANAPPTESTPEASGRASASASDNNLESAPPSKEQVAAGQPEESVSETSSSSEEQAPSGDVADSLPPPVENPATPLTAEERRRRTLRNLVQIGGALETYARRHGHYPPQANYDRRDDRLLSWRVHLLPMLGYESLYARFRLNEAWNSPHNRSLLKHIPEPYVSPDRFDEKTTYLAVAGAGTMFPHRDVVSPQAVSDGVGDTAMLVAVGQEQAVPWTMPADFAYRPSRSLSNLRSANEDGFYVVWGGGMATQVAGKHNDAALRPMFTIAGGETFDRSQVSQSPWAPQGESATSAVASNADAAESPEAGTTKAAGPGAADAPASAVSLPEELLSRAEAATNAGQFDDAVRWQYAAALVDDLDAEWSRQMHWSMALRRPVFAVRWGVGLRYISHGEIDDPSAIGSAASNRSRRSDSPIDRFLHYTGELGERLLEIVQSDIAEGLAGESLQQLSAQQSETNRSNSPVREPSRRNYNLPHSPGITLVGAADKDMLLALAKREGLDVLAFFDVETKKTRGGAVHNTTTLELYDVWSRRRFYSSGGLNNLQVYRARRNPLEEDPVAQTFTRLQTLIGEEVHCQQASPPALAPQHARERIEALAAGEYDNPLPVLLEMRLYHARGLLSRVELEKAFAQIIGEEAGLALVGGSKSEMLEALTRWLPESASG